MKPGGITRNYWRKNMQFKKLAVAISLSLGSALAMAENYQAEVGVAYMDIEETDAITVMGELHFNEVSTSGLPLEEAAYLGKSNNVALSYTEWEELDITLIRAEFYVGDFYIAPAYIDNSLTDGSALVSLGYASDNGLRIATTVPEEDYEANVDVKWVTKLSSGNFINLEAGFADGGDFDDSIVVGGDYYFDETFSAGAAFIDEGDSAFELRVNKFFTGTFKAGLSYVSSDDADVITVDAAIRF